MNKKLLTFSILVFGMVLLAGCSDDDPPPPPPPVTLTDISISPTSVPDGLPIDVEQQFTATGTYSDDSVQDLTASVTWLSSVPATASIDGGGLATGHVAGTANITASGSGLTSNSVALEVVNPTLVSITVAPATVPDPLQLGHSKQFQAEGVFDNDKSYDITSYVTWDSSLPVFATIDQTGLATAATVGETNISASTAAPAVVSNVVVLTTVLLGEIGLTIEPQNFEVLPINRQQQFVALLRLSDGTLQNVTDTTTWTSSNDDVANVNNTGQPGAVQGKSVGSTTITATDRISGQPDSITIEVNDATLESVTITPQNPANLPLGNKQAFAAEGVFSDGVSRILRGPQSWQVSDTATALMEFLSLTEGIALVTGLTSGSVNVTYTDYDATGMNTNNTDSVALIVTPAILQSIGLFPDTTQSVPEGVSVLFHATGVYTDTTSRDITNDVLWQSSDPAVGVFDIETKGKITTLPGSAPGTTNATAKMRNSEDPPVLITSPPVAVDVNTAALVSLRLMPTNVPVEVGRTEPYTAMGTFDDTTQFDYTDLVTWSSDDVGIATVSNADGTKGQVTGVSVGTAEITVTDPATGINASQGVPVVQE